MKTRKVAYFPVLREEQEVLERLRSPSLAARLPDVLGILDLVAEANATAADVEQALTLLEETRQLDPLEGRFDSLERRLAERIEKGLAEIEGRLARRTAGEIASDDGSEPPRKPAAPAEVPEDATLAFRIEGDMVSGPSASQFYVAVWGWLFDNGRVSLSDLPIQGRGKKRYVIAREPVHPTGRDFYRAEEVHGAFVEVNLSRKDIIRRSKQYLEHFGVRYEVLVGSD